MEIKIYGEDAKKINDDAKISLKTIRYVEGRKVVILEVEY